MGLKLRFSYPTLNSGKGFRNQDRLAQTMPTAIMAASPARRQTGFQPQRPQKQESQQSVAGAMSERLVEHQQREQRKAAQPDHAKRLRALNQVDEGFEDAGVDSTHDEAAFSAPCLAGAVALCKSQMVRGTHLTMCSKGGSGF